MSKPTMQDIAVMANVSSATVSRTLKNPEKVKAETRERIQAVMAESGYVYNASAGDLSRRKSMVVGVLLPAAQENMAFADTIQAIQSAALKLNYSLMMGVTNQDAATECELIQRFTQRNLAGLILAGFSPSNEALVRKLARDGTTCVVIWEKGHDSEINYVGFDNYAAMQALTKHLIDLGHRRIGLICGPYTKSERPYRRLMGYRAALEVNGLDYDPSMVVEGMPLLLTGKVALKQIMSVPKPPTAIIAANDMAAVGALSAANELGLSVPDDISVAGFDDIALASYTNPPLTSVRIPVYEMGKRAFEIVAEAQQVPAATAVSAIMDYEIMIRKSCKAL